MTNYPLYQHPDIANLKQLVAMQSDHIPDHIAFKYQKQNQLVEITYERFRQDIEAIGTYFYKQGLRKVKIAVLGENSYEWLLTYFAAVLGSNVIVPIDKELSNDAIGELLLRCDAAALVYSPSYSDAADEMLLTRKVAGIFNMDNFSEWIDTGRQLINDGLYDFVENAVEDDAPCSIIFTSGTTGIPKGVMLSQKNLMLDAVNACRNVSFDGSSLLALPLHHTFAFTAGVLMMLIYGLPVCINKGLRTFWTDMQTFKPHHMFLVPLYVETMYANICKQAHEGGEEKQLFGGELDLIISGGAPISQDLITHMDEFGIQVLNGYGITECAPVISVNRNRYFRENSVGLPLSCCEIRIEDGEIWVKGPNIMLGYYQDEISTKEAIEDGWFKTGDLGCQDEDGFLYVTGRKKNLIILSNGENVSSEELEDKIQIINHVKETIVYAEDGKITAEIFVENPDKDESGIRESIALLNRELPAYKRIQKIKFRNSEFEKTTTKKIKRSTACDSGSAK